MATKEQMETLRKLSRVKKRSMEIDAAMLNTEERTLTISFASENPCLIWGVREILIISNEAMDIMRFEQGVMPILFNHNRDAIIASINKIWIENKKAYAEIKFDDDDESIKMMKKVESGSCRGVSVGYKPKTYEIVERDAISADGFEGPCYIARKWEVLEVSLVSVPADPMVGAGRNEEDQDNQVDIIETKKEEARDEEMTPEEKARLEAEEAERKEKEAKARKEAAEIERKRCADINALCRDFSVEDSKRDEFINKVMDMDAVRSAILEIQKERNQATNTSKISVTETEEKKRCEAIADSILLRAGVALAKPAEGAGQFRSMRMRDLAIDLLERAGVSDARYMDDNLLFQRALTTGALSSILSNAANRSLSQGYAEAVTTYKEFTTVGTLSDFKEATRYKISAAGEPVVIPENGEFTYQKLSDEGVGVKLQTAGSGFTYTRQMFINDDLSVLAKMPAKVNASFERMKNRLVFDALAAVTYSSGNGNLAGTAAAISVASVGLGRAAMRKQKDIGSKATLNIAPRYLVVPAALETVAWQLINSTADPASSNVGVVNPFRGSLAVVADACLDVKSETAWYLVAEKGTVDTIEVSYLNGNQTPIMESGMDPDTLGWKFRLYHDFVIKALDYRGFYKNAGA